MSKPKKRARKASKKSLRVRVREMFEVRHKREERAKNDTLPQAPAEMRDNGVTFKVKLKRK